MLDTKLKNRTKIQNVKSEIQNQQISNSNTETKKGMNYDEKEERKQKVDL